MSYWTDTIFRRHLRSPGTSGGSLARLVLRLLEWQERAQQRYRLAELDDAALKDMGLHRADVAREIAKPFWMP